MLIFVWCVGLRYTCASKTRVRTLLQGVCLGGVEWTHARGVALRGVAVDRGRLSGWCAPPFLLRTCTGVGCCCCTHHACSLRTRAVNIAFLVLFSIFYKSNYTSGGKSRRGAGGERDPKDE